jgi:NitT/TauT family transport system substrate-binding protein
MLLLLLERDGLKETDVTIQEVPFPRMLSVMASGSVDAVAIAEPFVTIGRGQGARVLTWNYVEIRPRTDVSTYVTRADLAQNRSADLQAFHRALERATREIEANPNYARSILATELKLDSVVARGVGLPRFVAILDSANILQTAQASKRFGLLPADTDAEAVARALLAGKP